ncbi:flippase [Vibrio aestuarianus]|uniref:flippase n=1 Tax=Vibrio aestuarianus TaxID=28171 RepID=UPI00237CA6A5|nr:flippase [Vibrio aestuarianus]MDE1335111.1 flippase [Vibrio aestuarianus]
MNILSSNLELRKYFNSVNWQIFEKIVRIFSGLFVGVWVARYLGPVEYGILSWALSIVGICSFLSTLGLDSLVTRELSKNKVDKYEILGSTLVLRLVGSVLMSFLVLCVIFLYIEENTHLYVLITLSFIGIFQVAFTFEYYFQSEVRGDIIAKCRIFSLLIVALFKVYLIYSERGIVLFAISFLLDGFVLSALYLTFLKKANLNFRKLKFSYDISISLLKNSWPLMFSGLVMSIYMKIDQVMIKHLLDDRSVGLYSAAVRLSEAFNFLPVTICAAIFPLIMKSKESSGKLFSQRMTNLHSIMFWFALLIIFFFSICSETIVGFLYGKEFYEASNILIIHAWSALAVFISVSTTSWIISENLQKYKLIQDLFGAIFNILLNFILVPKYGIIGAAYATVISYTLTLIMLHVLIPKFRENLKYIFEGIIVPLRLLRKRMVL